jgi:SAM-dependent MidA family methyltransferase
MTTALGEKIKAIIQANGPITVTDFFSLCLADPEHGYYRTREPFGRSGDFVTAPEVSQLFGEMIGVFIVHAWQRHGTPAAVRLVEIGPGRGTMMADMLRVVARLAPPLFENMTVHLVETSDRLREVQQATLAQYDGKIAWHQGFDEVPPGFTLIAANELFDAIPIRQFVKTPTGFRERMVGLDADNELAFGPGIAGIDPDLLPEPAHNVPAGTLFEISPARQSVMIAICERLKAFGGTALAIDYGHFVTGFGDTLQAVRMHEFDPQFRRDCI